MAEIRTVTTLRSKRAEIIAAIANYEKKLAQARADLAQITAAIAIFEASGEIEGTPPYVDIHRCFKRGEAMTLCKEALAAHGPLNTRQLALKVMGAKGLDVGDKVLLARLENRPARLNLTLYPHLPAATVGTTDPRAYLALIASSAFVSPAAGAQA
jgi:hypothetical protein